MANDKVQALIESTARVLLLDHRNLLRGGDAGVEGSDVHGGDS